MDKADILKYFSSTRAGFLHAVGEPATERVLELMNVRDNDNILELGFGTGTTLIKILSRNKKANVHGIERSKLMIDAAKARLKFCGFNDCVDLKCVDSMQTLPYPDNTFDKVIIESVLAIQEENELLFLIRELRRILKPGGRLFANETLWLPDISKEEIDTINQKCKASFGIIQSNGAFKDQSGWKNFLKDSGLEVQKMEVIDGLKSGAISIPGSLTEVRSRLFTLQGKYRGKMNGELKREYHSYIKNMQAIYDPGKKYMEGVMMVAQKSFA
jgi:ubiquinone/menaquinone biosynthesis C-methylase UbiE